MFDENDILLGSEEDSLTGNTDPTDTVTGGSTDTLSGNIDPVVDEEDDTTGDNKDTTNTVVTYEEDSILNPEYVENVKQSQFGELYNRLVSDEQESQCAEFLAPQLIKQDRLYNHTFNAAFGQFY